MPPLHSLCAWEIRRQGRSRRDFGEATPLHHIGNAPLIDLKVRRDSRVVVLLFSGQLDHRDHVRREFCIFHFSVAFGKITP